MTAPPGLFRNLKGTSEDSFQVGKSGPLLQRIAATARLRLPNLLRWLPGGSAVQGWLKSDGSGDMSVVKSEFAKAVAPTVNDDSDDGYAIGSRWLDTTADKEYVCLDASVGAAVWKDATAQGTGDVSGPGSSIDLGIAVFNGTGGKTIKDSGKRNYGGSATDPSSPSPADGDLYFNTSLKKWMQYAASRSKWLSIESWTCYMGRSGGTPKGAYYRGMDGVTQSSADGYVTPHAGTIVAFGYTRTDTDSADFEIMASGTVKATVNSAAVKGTDVTLNADVSAGDVIALRNKTGVNDTSDVQAWVTLRWRV